MGWWAGVLLWLLGEAGLVSLTMEQVRAALVGWWAGGLACLYTMAPVVHLLRVSAVGRCRVGLANST